MILLFQHHVLLREVSKVLRHFRLEPVNFVLHYKFLILCSFKDWRVDEFSKQLHDSLLRKLLRDFTHCRAAIHYVTELHQSQRVE